MDLLAGHLRSDSDLKTHEFLQKPRSCQSKGRHRRGDRAWSILKKRSVVPGRGREPLLDAGGGQKDCAWVLLPILFLVGAGHQNPLPEKTSGWMARSGQNPIREVCGGYLVLRRHGKSGHSQIPEFLYQRGAGPYSGNGGPYY